MRRRDGATRSVRRAAAACEGGQAAPDGRGASEAAVVPRPVSSRRVAARGGRFRRAARPKMFHVKHFRGKGAHRGIPRPLWRPRALAGAAARARVVCRSPAAASVRFAKTAGQTKYKQNTHNLRGRVSGLGCGLRVFHVKRPPAWSIIPKLSRGCRQGVRPKLPKLVFAGSNPVTRSKKDRRRPIDLGRRFFRGFCRGRGCFQRVVS